MYNSRNLLKVVKEGGMSVLTLRADGSYGLTFIESPVFNGLTTTKKVVKENDGLSDVVIRRDLSHAAGLLFVEDAKANAVVVDGETYLFVKTYVHQGKSLYVKEGSEAATRIARKRTIEHNGENRFQHFEKLDSKKIQKAAKQLKSKEQYRICSVTFKEDGGRNNKDEVVKYKLSEKSIVTFGNNNIAKKCKTKDTKVSTLVKGIKTTRNVKNYINNIVLVALDTQIIDDIIKSVSKTVFMPRTKSDIIIELKDNMYFSIVKGEFVKFKDSWVEYFPAVYSTSAMNKDAVYFYKVDDTHKNWLNAISELIPDFEEELKNSGIKVDNHQTKEQRRKNIKKSDYEIDALKAIKLFGRPSLALTSAVRMGKLPGIAIYDGCFIPEDLRKVSASDGTAFHVNEIFAELFNITPFEAQRLCLQARTRNGRDKFASTGVSKKWTDSKIAEWEKEGKVRVIGDRDNIAIILDDNCVKLQGKNSKDLDFKLINIAEPGKGESSIQMLLKAVFAAAESGDLDELCKYLVDTGKEQLLQEVEEKLNEEDKDAKLGSTYFVDVIKQLNGKNPILKNSKLSEIQNSCKNRIAKMKFDFKIEFGMLVPDRIACITNGNCEVLKHDDKVTEIFYGKYSTTIGNKKFYLDKLHDDLVKAVYSNDDEKAAEIREEVDRINEEIKSLEEEFGETTMYKYPSASHIEYIKATLVDSYELSKRIEKMNISELDKEEAIRGLRYASTGIIMMPNDTELMSLLAGFDFDADEAFMCFDKKLNSFLPYNNARIALNKDSDKKVKMLPIDKNLINEMIAMQLLLDDSVGMVTVEFTNILMLLIDMLNGSKIAYKTALHFLNEAFGENHYTIEKDYYESPKDRVVSTKFVDHIIKEIITVEWSETNVKLFLLDCAFVGRFYQESIIDATKTGEFFVRFIHCTTVKLSSRQPLAFDDNGNMYRIKFELKNEDGSTKVKYIHAVNDEGIQLPTIDRVVEYMEYKDVFARMQDELIEFYNNEITEKVNAAFEDYKYTDEDVRVMNALMKEIRINAPEEYRALMKCKTAYGVIMNKKMKDLGFTEDEDEIKVINETFDIYFNALRNNVEDIFDRISENYRELNRYDRGALLLAFSIFDKYHNVLDAYSSNRFAYIIDNYSTIAFLTDSEDSTYRTYAEILHDEGKVSDGDVITLDRGIDIDNLIICESTYSGQAIYVEDGEETYLMQERPISDLVKNERRDESSRLIVLDNRKTIGDILEVFNTADKANTKVLADENMLGVYKKNNENKFELVVEIESELLTTADKARKVNGKFATSFDEGKPCYFVFLV